MTDAQRVELDEVEARAPFVTRNLRTWPLPEMDWQAIAQAHAARITQLECEVAWLRRELEQAKGEAQ